MRLKDLVGPVTRVKKKKKKKKRETQVQVGCADQSTHFREVIKTHARQNPLPPPSRTLTLSLYEVRGAPQIEESPHKALK